MVNNCNMLTASILLLFLGAMPVYADGAGIEGETLNQELLALCKTPEATPAIIETLLKDGADVNARTELDFSPLILAAMNKSNLAIIETLLKAGAHVNARNEGGNTPLMHAARHNSNLAIIKTLLKAGAHVNARNEGGNTP